MNCGAVSEGVWTAKLAGALLVESVSGQTELKGWRKPPGTI